LSEEDLVGRKGEGFLCGGDSEVRMSTSSSSLSRGSALGLTRCVSDTRSSGRSGGSGSVESESDRSDSTTSDGLNLGGRPGPRLF